MMKTTKKVRTVAKPTAKNRIKKSWSDTRSVTKKDSDTKSSSAKKQSQTSIATNKTENDKSKIVKTSQGTKLPANTKANIPKKLNGKRTNREISGSEYATFTKRIAKKEQVSPECLVTVDRRVAHLSGTGKHAHPEELGEKLDRRQKIQRRRQIDPTTCERDYSLEEIEFMNALDEYKRNSGRMFPTCSEILEVFRNLGYTKLSHEEGGEINVNPESDDIFATVTETGTMSYDEEIPVMPNSQES